MAFKERLMTATFVLGTGTFGNTGQNEEKLSGLRMSAQISRAGGPAQATLSAELYGMKLDTMQQLSTLGMVATTLRRNSITITAGDSASQTVVFQGTIVNAYPDMSSAPDVPFRVEASNGALEIVKPADAQSFTGPTDVAVILSGIATQLGVPFENNGVSVILSSPYYYGSLRSQAWAAVQDAGICWNGMEDGTLAIWNPGEARGGEAPLVSKLTGMDGYPSFTSNGISLRTLFNPSIGFGKKIKVESTLKGACGTWSVYDLNHHLESQMPKGAWFSDLKAAPLGLGPFVP